MSRPQSPSEHPESHGHEADRTSVRGTVWVVVALLGLIALTMVVVYWFREEVLEHRPLPPPYARPQPDVQSPSATLEGWIEPVTALDELRRREHAQLSGYRWIDRAAGRVQIPIDQAMELLVARARPTTASAPATAPKSPESQPGPTGTPGEGPS